MKNVSCWFLLLVTLGFTRVGAWATEDNEPNKIVRVVTVSEALLGDSSDRFGDMMVRLDQAAGFHPDIACLPEFFSNRPPEPVPGPTSDRLAAWATAHSAYVIFGMKRKVGERTYNSAILIDRKGRVAGIYDGIHPDELQLKEGATPGNILDPPIFQTDFGAIGVLICFDVEWWDLWKRLKEKGAKIVFWPSAFPATRQLTALALKNQFYIVSSTLRGTSAIYDITGEILSSSGEYHQWAGAIVPMDKRLLETDFNLEKLHQAEQKYGSKIQIVWFHDDDWFTLASLDPHLRVEDIMSEFGLIPQDQYHIRSTKAIDKARNDAHNAVPHVVLRHRKL